VLAGGVAPVGLVNTGSVHPNVYKVLFTDKTITDDFIGTFIPEGVPFTHTAGGN